MAKKDQLREEYVRSVIFGFEDGLVSTTGVVTGIAAGAQTKSVVVLAGLVVIAVEALSMGAGQYLSERATHQLKEVSFDKAAIVSGLLMYISYFLAGLVPMIPILLLPLQAAIPIGIVCAYLGLFTLGYIKGKVLEVGPIKSGLEILIIGGIATTVGLVVGALLRV